MEEGRLWVRVLKERYGGICWGGESEGDQRENRRAKRVGWWKGIVESVKGEKG